MYHSQTPLLFSKRKKEKKQQIDDLRSRIQRACGFVAAPTQTHNARDI